jgi:predicted MPP superfamily phosphohydrolase
MPWKDKLTWIHLSDLHFGHGDDASGDQNVVMEGILRDVSLIKQTGRRPDYIFVTGDIASSAIQEEYAAAAEWLDRLLETVGLEHERLLLVPGNHDVNRKIATRPDIAGLHLGFRTSQTLFERAFKNRAATGIDDRQAMAVLWKKLEAYQEFAKRYGSPEISASSPFWRKSLDGHSRPVEAIGLNTTLLSFDDGDKGNLLLGMHQRHEALDKVTKGALVLVLQHHPSHWLRDGDKMLARIMQVPHIIFCGHVHEASARVRDDIEHGFRARRTAGSVGDRIDPLRTP